MPRRASVLLLLAVLGSALLAACQPSGRAITIEPGAVLLTAAGQTASLAGTVVDANGTPVDADLSWSSSDPAVATVAADGTVTAVADLGTALITASAGNDRSAAAYVVVAQPAAAAELVPDAAVVEGPVPVDPAAGDPAGPFSVLLRGVEGLEPGDLVLGTGEAPLGGRVTAVTDEGGDARVEFVVVPPGELFARVAFRDEVGLAGGEAAVPAAIAEAYTLARDGDTYTFTPRAARDVSADVAPAAARVDAAGRPVPPPAAGVVGGRALPGFECESEFTLNGTGRDDLLPLAFGVAPSVSIKLDGTLKRELTDAGLSVVVTGTPEFKVSAEASATSEFEGKLECKGVFLDKAFPVPGPLGLFLGGIVEFGGGLSVGGKVPIAGVKMSAGYTFKPVLSATLACPAAGSCSLTGDATTGEGLVPEVKLTAPELNQVALAPSFQLFGFVGFSAGNPIVDSVRFGALEIKAGPELGGSFTLEALQIDDRDPENGVSKYELKLAGEVGPALELEGWLKYLGFASGVPLKVSVEVPISASPAGTVKANRDAWSQGDDVVVEVNLTTATFVGLYNVDRVEIRRRVGAGLGTEVLATADASDGQSAFRLSFAAPANLKAGELYAFVVPVLALDRPALELGAAGTPVAAGRRFAGTITEKWSGIPSEETTGPASVTASVTVTVEVSPPEKVGSFTVRTIRILEATGTYESAWSEYNPDRPGLTNPGACLEIGSESATFQATTPTYGADLIAGYVPEPPPGGWDEDGDGLETPEGPRMEIPILGTTTFSPGCVLSETSVTDRTVGFYFVPVFEGGEVVALDFERSYVDYLSGIPTVQTGRLVLLP